MGANIDQQIIVLTKASSKSTPNKSERILGNASESRNSWESRETKKGTEIDQKWGGPRRRAPGTKMEPKWNQTGATMESKWNQNEATLEQHASKIVPEID